MTQAAFSYVAAPAAWVAIVPPCVLDRCTEPLAEADGHRCPLCYRTLAPDPDRCPACGLALNWWPWQQRYAAALEDIAQHARHDLWGQMPLAVEDLADTVDAAVQAAGEAGALLLTRPAHDDLVTQLIRWAMAMAVNE